MRYTTVCLLSIHMFYFFSDNLCWNERIELVLGQTTEAACKLTIHYWVLSLSALDYQRVLHWRALPSLSLSNCCRYHSLYQLNLQYFICSVITWRCVIDSLMCCWYWLSVCLSVCQWEVVMTLISWHIDWLTVGYWRTEVVAFYHWVPLTCL